MPASTLLLASACAAFLCLAVVALRFVALTMKAGVRRDDGVDPDSPFAVSRFTIPVSIIVPAGDSAARLEQALARVLDLSYPEYEVIVVADAARVESFATLAQAWALEANEFFYRQSIMTAPLRRIYRSARDARLVLADKPTLTNADALNCGVNLARYRYVLVLPDDLRFDRQALLRLMAAPLRDPAAIVGASAHIEPTATFAWLRALRSLMVSRLTRRSAHALPPADSISVWRRDAILGAGGFSAHAWDMELDLAWRAVASARRAGLPGRFHRSGEIFGRSDRQAPRWTRVAESVRQMALGLLAGRSPAAASRHLLSTEVLPAVAAAWFALSLSVVAGSGSVSAVVVVAALFGLSFGLAVVSVAALLVRSTMVDAPDHAALTKAMVASSCELVVRPAVAALTFVRSYR